MKPAVGLELQGRYQLLERIALGGMGEVWRATDLRSGRVVAAKILRPELAGDEIFLTRLRAEATNSRGLRHPNLAVVLDAGERDGSGWIIMELVQGRALSDIIAEKGTLPPAQILPILAQVARALQVVHDSGVIHRDVKPSNILINREGLAKLTDFGISTGVNQRPLTATGMVMGTAQYLAPEQAMGNMATAAGDLYALGIIAYEALVGHRPFTGTTQVDIAFAHVNEPVPPLPASIPAEVSDMVMDLLAKKPADRPRTAREVARRLDRIVVNLPADSWDPRQTPTWASTGRRVDRSRSDDPVFQKTMDWYFGLVDKGYMPPRGAFSTTSGTDVQLGSGSIAMCINGSWMFNTYANLEINVGIAANPVGPNGKSVSLFNGLGDSIAKQSGNIENASKWVAFLGTAEAQDIVASYGVVFPAIASSTRKAVEVFERTGLPTAPFTDHVDRGTTFYFPLTYFGADVAAIMKPATDALWAERRPASTLTRANEQINLLFETSTTHDKD